MHRGGYPAWKQQLAPKGGDSSRESRMVSGDFCLEGKLDSPSWELQFKCGMSGICVNGLASSGQGSSLGNVWPVNADAVRDQRPIHLRLHHAATIPHSLHPRAELDREMENRHPRRRLRSTKPFPLFCSWEQIPSHPKEEQYSQRASCRANGQTPWGFNIEINLSLREILCSRFWTGFKKSALILRRSGLPPAPPGLQACSRGWGCSKVLL